MLSFKLELDEMSNINYKRRKVFFFLLDRNWTLSVSWEIVKIRIIRLRNGDCLPFRGMCVVLDKNLLLEVKIEIRYRNDFEAIIDVALEGF